jgi:hypothetical protein
MMLIPATLYVRGLHVRGLEGVLGTRDWRGCVSNRCATGRGVGGLRSSQVQTGYPWETTGGCITSTPSSLGVGADMSKKVNGETYVCAMPRHHSTQPPANSIGVGAAGTTEPPRGNPGRGPPSPRSVETSVGATERLE